MDHISVVQITFFLWFNRELDLSDRIKSKADEDGYEISGWRMKAELEELRSPREVNLVWTCYLISIIIIFRWKLDWFKTRLFFQQMLQLWIRFKTLSFFYNWGNFQLYLAMAYEPGRELKFQCYSDKMRNFFGANKPNKP